MMASSTSLAPPMRPGSVPSDLAFCFARLFDPTNYDHTSVEAQVAKYKVRDLKRSKIYATAIKIFSTHACRKRIIVAAPMEKVRGRVVHTAESNLDPTEAGTVTDKGTGTVTGAVTDTGTGTVTDTGTGTGTGTVTDTGTGTVSGAVTGTVTGTVTATGTGARMGKDNAARFVKAPLNLPEHSEELRQVLDKARSQVSKLSEYKAWIGERRDLRDRLESLGLSESWLAKKPDKTPLERRVLNQLIEANKPRVPTPPIGDDKSLAGVLPDTLPNIERPAPLAFRTLHRYITEKKLRLLDMFRSVDKDKSWSLSRDEFKDMINKYDIPISDILLEDFVLALDTNLNDEIEYKELSKGLEKFKLEERKKNKDQQQMGAGGRKPALEMTAVRNQAPGVQPPSSGLRPPPQDLREEQMILSSEEAMLDLRKRDREALARSLGKKLSRSNSGHKKRAKVTNKTVVKTGNRAVDDHCRPSTLVGETGQLVDKFRQLKYKEFVAVVNLCRERDLVLDEKILERVLLYPPDKPHSQIRKKIRVPGDDSRLLSRHFADPPAKPRTPMEVKHKDRIKKSKSGQLLIDSRHEYPEKSKVLPQTTKMYLSSGRAFVRRKVDCWMTFEEYDRLTSKLAVRYKQLHGNVNHNAFWPGHLLDRVRLCMDDPRPAPGRQSIFQPIRQPIGSWLQQ